MKITRANIQEYVVSHGLEEVQIDGIPEGFSFKEPDITISDKPIKGNYLAFIPLSDGERGSRVTAATVGELLELYTNLSITWQKK